jgi:bifunctional non-homologous end joining protein LigD
MPIFVIHEHNATHLHWDLRLEIGGMLKSWALPKQPPRTKGMKRLAIQVEDHLRSYANFQGEIKEGYGKGTVVIWDQGKFHLIEQTPKKLEFELQGTKLRGRYVLIKTDYPEHPEKSWLFFKV